MKTYSIWYRVSLDGYQYLFLSAVPGADLAMRIVDALNDDMRNVVAEAWAEED